MSATVQTNKFKCQVLINLNFTPNEMNVAPGEAIIRDGFSSALLPNVTFAVYVYPFGTDTARKEAPCPAVALVANDVCDNLNFEVTFALSWGSLDRNRDVFHTRFNSAEPLIHQFSSFHDYVPRKLFVTVYVVAMIQWDFGLTTTLVADLRSKKISGQPRSIVFSADDSNPTSFTVSNDKIYQMKPPVFAAILQENTDRFVLFGCSNETTAFIAECFAEGSFPEYGIDMFTRLGKEVSTLLMALKCSSALRNIVFETLKTLETRRYCELTALLKFVYVNRIPGITGMLIQYFAKTYGDNTVRIRALGKDIEDEILALNCIDPFAMVNRTSSSGYTIGKLPYGLKCRLAELSTPKERLAVQIAAGTHKILPPKKQNIDHGSLKVTFDNDEYEVEEFTRGVVVVAAVFKCHEMILHRAATVNLDSEIFDFIDLTTDTIYLLNCECSHAFFRKLSKIDIFKNIQTLTIRNTEGPISLRHILRNCENLQSIDVKSGFPLPNSWLQEYVSSNCPNLINLNVVLTEAQLTAVDFSILINKLKDQPRGSTVELQFLEGTPDQFAQYCNALDLKLGSEESATDCCSTIVLTVGEESKLWEIPSTPNFTIAADEDSPTTYPVPISKLSTLESPVITAALTRKPMGGTIVLKGCCNDTAWFMKEYFKLGSFMDLRVDLLSHRGRKVYLLLKSLECATAMGAMITATKTAIQSAKPYNQVEALLDFAYFHKVPGFDARMNNIPPSELSLVLCLPINDTNNFVDFDFEIVLKENVDVEANA